MAKKTNQKKQEVTVDCDGNAECCGQCHEEESRAAADFFRDIELGPELCETCGTVMSTSQRVHQFRTCDSCYTAAMEEPVHTCDGCGPTPDGDEVIRRLREELRIPGDMDTIEYVQDLVSDLEMQTDRADQLEDHVDLLMSVVEDYRRFLHDAEVVHHEPLDFEIMDLKNRAEALTRDHQQLVADLLAIDESLGPDRVEPLDGSIRDAAIATVQRLREERDALDAALSDSRSTATNLHFASELVDDLIGLLKKSSSTTKDA